MSMPGFRDPRRHSGPKFLAGNRGQRSCHRILTEANQHSVTHDDRRQATARVIANQGLLRLRIVVYVVIRNVQALCAEPRFGAPAMWAPIRLVKSNRNTGNHSL